MIENEKEQPPAPPNTPQREERSSLPDRQNHPSTPSRHPSTLSNTTNTNQNPPTTPGASERSAVVLALFGPSVGPCIGDFSTTYNRVNGRLYAATKALLFYSNLFGFERRLCLQFSDVTEVELFGSTSIRVNMVDCEEYIFKKIAHRVAVLELLKELVSADAAGGGADESMTTRNWPLRLPPDPPVNNTGIPSSTTADEESNDEDDLTTRPHLSSEPSAGELLPPASRPRSQSVPLLSWGNNDRGNAAVPPRRILSSLGSQEIPAKANSDSEEDLLVPQDGSGTTTTNTTPSGQKDDSDDGAIKLQWEEAKQLLDETALKATVFPCRSLDKFCDLFFADQAPHPIEKYQREAIGDQQIHVYKWSPTLVSTLATTTTTAIAAKSTRTIDFWHPLKNSLGPSKAKTLRQQTIRRFGKYGIVLENTTVVQGVPAADCFRVRDRWTIEAAAVAAGATTTTTATATAGGLTMTVTFRIEFTKTTMFKPIIQKNIRQETKNWFQGYVKMLHQVLAQEGGGLASPTGGAATVLEPTTTLQSPSRIQNEPLDTDTDKGMLQARTATILWNLLAKVGLGFALIYLLLQVRWMRAALSLVQSETEQLGLQNEQLLLAIQDLTAAISQPKTCEGQYQG